MSNKFGSFRDLDDFLIDKITEMEDAEKTFKLQSKYVDEVSQVIANHREIVQCLAEKNERLKQSQAELENGTRDLQRSMENLEDRINKLEVCVSDSICPCSSYYNQLSTFTCKKQQLMEYQEALFGDEEEPTDETLKQVQGIMNLFVQILEKANGKLSRLMEGLRFIEHQGSLLRISP